MADSSVGLRQWTESQVAPGHGMEQLRRQAASLADLADIHLPEPVSFWPPAPAWWVTVALVLILGAIMGALLLRYWRGTRYRREGLAQLEALYAAFGRDRDPTRYLAGFAAVLKRVALVAFPRREVAALTGDRWVAFLDATAVSPGFCDGPGEVLVRGQYMKHVDFTIEPLHQLGIQWVRRHTASGRHRVAEEMPEGNHLDA